MTKLSAIAVSCLGGLCLLFVNAYAAPAAQTETLAQIHAKAGFQWPKDESRVNNNPCFACHKSYEELAKKTANLDPNPHKSHLGNVRCTECHSGYGKSQLMCNTCHKFDLKPSK